EDLDARRLRVETGSAALPRNARRADVEPQLRDLQIALVGVALHVAVENHVERLASLGTRKLEARGAHRSLHAGGALSAGHGGAELCVQIRVELPRLQTHGLRHEWSERRTID